MSSESFYLLAAKVLSNEATPLEVADLENIMAENQEWKAVFQNLEELWNTQPPPVYRPDSYRRSIPASPGKN
ncbi:MAG: hypothetical protein V9E88_00920 [Ferruginibacter sp.]